MIWKSPNLCMGISITISPVFSGSFLIYPATAEHAFRPIKVIPFLSIDLREDKGPFDSMVRKYGTHFHFLFTIFLRLKWKNIVKTIFSQNTKSDYIKWLFFFDCLYASSKEIHSIIQLKNESRLCVDNLTTFMFLVFYDNTYLLFFPGVR